MWHYCVFSECYAQNARRSLLLASARFRSHRLASARACTEGLAPARFGSASPPIGSGAAEARLGGAAPMRRRQESRSHGVRGHLRARNRENFRRDSRGLSGGSAARFGVSFRLVLSRFVSSSVRRISDRVAIVSDNLGSSRRRDEGRWTRHRDALLRRQRIAICDDGPKLST